MISTGLQAKNLSDNELSAKPWLPKSKQHASCLDETSTHVHGLQVARKEVHVVQDKTHPCSKVDHRKTGPTFHQKLRQCAVEQFLV